MNCILRPRCRHRNYGLTLLDLLIALTVVGLLAAMLFPVFASARRRANLATCASHLHTLGHAIQMYQADYDDQLPPTNMEEECHPTVKDIFSAYGVHDNEYQCPEGYLSYQDGSSYTFRFTFDFGNELNDWYFGFDHTTYLPHCRQIVPQPQSVLAFCPWHLPYGREWTQPLQTLDYLILRANGSVERIQQKRVLTWQYNKNHDKDHGKWLPPGTSLRAETLEFYAFPNEPFPPTLRANSSR